MEKAHADSINAFLVWLNFNRHRDKFVFVLNKSDILSSEDKQNNLAAMLEKFGANTGESPYFTNEDGSLDSMRMNIAVGFPPDVRFAEVEEDYKSLTKAVLYGTHSTNHKRIAVDKSSCNIL